jgi:nucleoside-diphosphate-sugar epimerase
MTNGSRSACVFITGATGFVGSHLVPLLRKARPERRIVALVRDPGRATALSAQGCELVIGDVTRPQMGIVQTDYQRLSAEVTQIIHAAGDVNFGASLPVSRAANVFGTQQAINFARVCARLDRFAHLSTISVHGTRPGPLLEDPCPAGNRFVNSYQRSKHEAEWLVLRAIGEIPAEIFRLSLVGADSPAGTVTQFNYVHHVIRYLPNSPLPAMPGDPDTCVDLITADWAVGALAWLFDNHFQPGAIRNLSGAPAGSLRLGEMVELARKVLERNLNVRVAIPSFTSTQEFESIVTRSGDQRVKSAAAVLGPHIMLLGSRQSFPNDRALADLDGSGLTPAPLQTWCANMIEYCVKSNWGEGGGTWSMVAPRPPDVMATGSPTR